MPMTSEEFAFALKQKYPQYRELPNDELVRRVVERYPQYRSEIVDLGGGAPEEPGYLRSAESISATPWYQQHVIPGTNVESPISVEGAAEALPAAYATAAAMAATKHPGVAGTVGGMAGEVARQMFRRAVGASAAPGVVQEGLGLDPNSPEAAVAGLAGEGAAGVSGALLSKLLRVFGRGAERGALKDVLRLIQPRNAREIARAPQLAERAVAEGVIPPGSSRPTQIARAQKALDSATAEAERLKAEAIGRGQKVEAGPVLGTAIDEVPPMLPTGTPRRIDRAERMAAVRNAEDANDVILSRGGGLTGSEVPIEVAIGEREALDKALTAMYEAGRDKPALGKRPVQATVDAWRSAIADADPTLGKANLRRSDLITITEILKEQEAKSILPQRGEAAAAALGAGAVGRMSVPAMFGLRTLVENPRFASLSRVGKALATKVFNGGAKTAQLWIRAADLSGLDEDTDTAIKQAERNRRAQRALRIGAEGVVD